MKWFKFIIEVQGYEDIRSVKANHLQGAIRQMYQTIPGMKRVVRIL